MKVTSNVSDQTVAERVLYETPVGQNRVSLRCSESCHSHRMRVIPEVISYIYLGWDPIRILLSDIDVTRMFRTPSCSRLFSAPWL